MKVASELRPDFYYVGSFDDEIRRYNKSALDLAYINETLKQAVLFGGPLLINDGQLMLYSDGRRALTDREASPLIDLIEAGYVRLFSRNGGRLSQLPEEMEHIPTYADLLKSPEWKILQGSLKVHEEKFVAVGACENWPSLNMGSGFEKLVTQAMKRYRFDRDLSDDQGLVILEMFKSRMRSDRKAAARTVWREVCESEELEIAPTGKAALHWMGIEAYHYNLAMASCANDSSRRPGLITRYSSFFEEISTGSSFSSTEGASLFEIPKPTLPRGVDPQSLLKGAFLRQVADAKSEISAKKKDYLDAVQGALMNKYLVEEVKTAAKSYSAELGKLLPDPDPSLYDELLKTVPTFLGKAGAILVEHSHLAHHQEVGMVLDPALRFCSAWMVKKTMASLPPVPLAVDVLKPPDAFHPKIPRAGQTVRGRECFAFLRVGREIVDRHLADMPAF